MQQAVDDLVDGAVAAERDDDVQAVEGGLAGELRGVAAVGGLDDVELDLAGQGVGEDVARPGAGRRGLGVDDQQRAHLSSVTATASREPRASPSSAGSRCCSPSRASRSCLLGIGYGVASLSDTSERAPAELAAAASVLAGVVLLVLARAADHGKAWSRSPAIVLNVFPLPVALGVLQAGVWWVAVPMVVLAGAAVPLRHARVRDGSAS